MFDSLAGTAAQIRFGNNGFVRQQREPDANRDSARSVIGEIDLPAVFLNNIGGDGKSQAGPLPRLLGREERLQNVWQLVDRDAAPVVGNAQFHKSVLHR